MNLLLPATTSILSCRNSLKAYRVCSAASVEGWAISSAYARPASLMEERSFEVRKMAVRTADVPALAGSSG